MSKIHDLTLPEITLKNDTNAQQFVESFHEDLHGLINTARLKRDKFRNDEDFIEHVFYRAHRKILKKYTLFSSFNDLVEKGEYDCVSGTILYSLIFTELGLQHQIIEFPTHTFIFFPDRNILIESTNELHGFINRKKALKDYFKYFDILEIDNDYTFLEPVEIKFDELKGLQYVNAAVRSRSSGNPEIAFKYLELADKYYQGTKINVLRRILMHDQLVILQ
jgi:hypothetical protein